MSKKAVAQSLVLGPRAWADVMKAELNNGKMSGRTSKSWRTKSKHISPSTCLAITKLRSKRLMIFKQMLKHIQYPDLKVADLMMQGFPLVGALDEVDVFEKKFPEDEIVGADPEWLYRTGKMSREALCEHIRSANVDEIARSIYSQPYGGPDSEVSKGWADGPYTEEELVETLGALCLPCRRFGVKQGLGKQGNPKIRPTDDFSEYYHNACVFTRDEVSVSGVDGINHFCKLWAETIYKAKQNPDGEFSMTLDEGSVIKCRVHPEVLNSDLAMVGKCLDIESACRQLAVRPAHSLLVFLD